MNQTISTKQEIIAVKMNTGMWSIIPFTFQLDPGDSFRTIYTTFINVGPYILKLYKPSRSGRMFYKQVPNE